MESSSQSLLSKWTKAKEITKSSTAASSYLRTLSNNNPLLWCCIQSLFVISLISFRRNILFNPEKERHRKELEKAKEAAEDQLTLERASAAKALAAEKAAAQEHLAAERAAWAREVASEKQVAAEALAAERGRAEMALAAEKAVAAVAIRAERVIAAEEVAENEKKEHSRSSSGSGGDHDASSPPPPPPPRSRAEQMGDQLVQSAESDLRRAVKDFPHSSSSSKSRPQQSKKEDAAGGADKARSLPAGSSRTRTTPTRALHACRCC